MEMVERMQEVDDRARSNTKRLDRCEVWLKSVSSKSAATDSTSYPYAISPYKIYGLKW